MKPVHLITLITLTVALLSLIFNDFLLQNDAIRAVSIVIFAALNTYGLSVTDNDGDSKDSFYTYPISIVAAGAFAKLTMSINITIIAAIIAAIVVGKAWFKMAKSNSIIVANIAFIAAHVLMVYSTNDVVLPTLLYIAIVAICGMTRDFLDIKRFTTIVPIAIAIFLLVMVVGGEDILPKYKPGMNKIERLLADKDEKERSEEPKEETVKPKEEESSEKKVAPKKEIVKEPAKQEVKQEVKEEVKQEVKVEKPAAIKPLKFTLNENWSSEKRSATFKLTELIIAPKYTEATLVIHNPANDGTLYLETASSYESNALAINVDGKSYRCTSINGSSSRCEINIKQNQYITVKAKFLPIPRDTKVVTLSEGFMGSFHQGLSITFEFIDVELGTPVEL